MTFTKKKKKKEKEEERRICTVEQYTWRAQIKYTAMLSQSNAL